jgi:hypothetical protein
MMSLLTGKRFIIFLCIALALFLAWRFIRPMNIFVVHEKFARPMDIEIPAGLDSLSAKECGTCHEEQYNEWSSSMHAMAWTDPYYRVDYVFDGSQQICLNCHIPLRDQQEYLVTGFRDKAMFKPILKPNPGFDAALQSEGVTCAVCHVRNGTVIGPNGSGHAPHPVTADPSMSQGMKPCEKCHVVSGKRWDTFYSIPPCGTVAEIMEKDLEPDCVGCHMPETDGTKGKRRKQHLFRGGHHAPTVAHALKVDYTKRVINGKHMFQFTLTNIGASHYLPTGTPDRHLTFELRLLDSTGAVIREKINTMKRYILWRPFIIDLKDTRLPYNEPRQFAFSVPHDNNILPATLNVTVRYHLLDEKRRKRIGYENTEPIAYEIYREKIQIAP